MAHSLQARRSCPQFPHGRRSGSLKMGWATLGCRSPKISARAARGCFVDGQKDGYLFLGWRGIRTGRPNVWPILNAIPVNHHGSCPPLPALPLSVSQLSCPCRCLSVSCPRCMTLMYQVPTCRRNGVVGVRAKMRTDHRGKGGLEIRYYQDIQMLELLKS